MKRLIVLAVAALLLMGCGIGLQGCRPSTKEGPPSGFWSNFHSYTDTPRPYACADLYLNANAYSARAIAHAYHSNMRRGQAHTLV